MKCYHVYGNAVDNVDLRGGKMNSNTNGDSYIGIDEAAEYLGIRAVTLRNWIKKKSDLPAHRIGKFWKFKRSELDEWVASGKSAIE
jgi:excisionase family DNA binding protein